MLQTNKSWELESRGQVLGTFFNVPGLRQYPCVQIPLNLHLFHVDVIFSQEHQNEGYWSRFIFDELTHALQFIERDDVVDSRISLQSRRYDNDEYTINSIVEIVEGKDRDGHKTHVYKCSNNIDHIDSFIVESESELSETQTVWQRTNDGIVFCKLDRCCKGGINDNAR